MSNVKSISAVNTSNGWAVCQSNSDGSALYVLPDIFEPKYSREQAERVAESLKRHLEAGGKTFAKPLPTDVKLNS